MPTIWSFEDFRLTDGGLTRGDAPVALEPTPLRVLLYLVEHRGRVVSRLEILRAVWPDASVTRDSLDRAISQLRWRLGDESKPYRFLRTLPRLGFQFVAPVAMTMTELGASRARGDARCGDDASHFVRDVNIPDGTTLKVDTRFVKQWEIANVGTVPWVDRRLVRLGPPRAKGRLQSPESVPIPDTMPGQPCLLTVELVTPSKPGSCHADFKMVDSAGARCFPGNELAVYVSVDVEF